MRLSSFRVALLACVIPFGASLSFAQTTAPVNDGLDMRFANGIAAIVEGKVITVDDIRREIAPFIARLQSESRNEKEFTEKLQALQDDVIQNLIDRQLIVKDFYKDENRRIPESIVDNIVSEQLATEFEGDRSKLLAYLRKRGQTMRDYRKDVEEDIIYNYMRQEQRKSQSIVSPVRVETYYNENRDRFYQDDQVKLRIIQLTRKSGVTDQELLDRAAVITQRFESGTPFADLAKEYTEDARRAKGGDWGWQKKGDLKPDFSDPLFALKSGEITKPIVQPEGCYILFAEERKNAGIQPLDEVRDQIEGILTQQMARQSQERWLERLRRNGYVKLF